MTTQNTAVSQYHTHEVAQFGKPIIEYATYAICSANITQNLSHGTLRDVLQAIEQVSRKILEWKAIIDKDYNKGHQIACSAH